MRVAVRVDSGTAIGAGHLMRCLTLAEELRDRGAHIQFVTRTHPGHLGDLPARRGFDVHHLPSRGQLTEDPATWLDGPPAADAEATLRALAGNGPLDWVIVDHYAIDAAWHRTLRPHTRAIAAIDDLADRQLDAEVVLDQNHDAGSRDYVSRTPPTARLLLGLRYCLLPRPIRDAGGATHRSPRPRPNAHVLISLGGGDPANDTAHVIARLHDALASVAHVDVVIGHAHPDPTAIAARCERWTNAVLHVQTERMADLLANADLAIGGGGTSTWERLYLGVPSIVLPLAANQTPTVALLAHDGLVLSPGSDWRRTTALEAQVADLLDDPPRRGRLAAAGRRAIDGNGVHRVAAALMNGG